MNWIQRILWGLVAILLLMALCSCSVLPEWRVFQKKVPATMTEKPPAQVEGEKRAAAYIREVTRPPVANPGAVVEKVHEVATDLSASLGEPARPVSVEDKDAIIASLRAGLKAKDDQLDKWKAFGRKYGGKELEGTGVDLAGPAGLVGFVAVIVACVAFPPIGYALLRVLPLLWGFFRRTTAAIAEAAASSPDAANVVKARLSSRLDEAHKVLVRRWAAPPKPSTP